MSLQAVLDWLSSVPSGTAFRPCDLYGAGSQDARDRAAIQRDLWRRACEIEARGEITEAELRIWGHWYGVADGSDWSHAEVRRRHGTGRDYTDRRVRDVTLKVAQTFHDQPPAVPAIGSGQLRRSDLQEAGASVIARAVAEERRHQGETYVNVHDLLRAARAGPAATRTRLGRPGGQRRNLKTTRHAVVCMAEWHRAILDAAVRRLARLGAPDVRYLPLWKPVEPVSDDLETAFGALQDLQNTGARSAIARALQDGHHHMLRGRADRELMTDFLFLETAILRDSYNLTALPVLDVLEDLMPAGDYRRTIIARERAHILEAHHLWAAAELWLAKADARLRNPAVHWPDQDTKVLSAVNILIRGLSVRSAQAIAGGTLTQPGSGGLQSRIQTLLARVAPDSAGLREWRHLAERLDVQVRFAVKGIEGRYGLRAGWDDDELSQLASVDRDVTALHIPARTLAWNVRKLTVLHAASRPADFCAALADAMPGFGMYGPIWPNQVGALRVVLESVLRRRSKGWIAVKHDVHDLLSLLPDDTDGMLRHPLAIPRPLIMHGMPVI